MLHALKVTLEASRKVACTLGPSKYIRVDSENSTDFHISFDAVPNSRMLVPSLAAIGPMPPHLKRHDSRATYAMPAYLCLFRSIEYLLNQQNTHVDA